MMDSDSSIKFSFSFFLAILFHLLLLALVFLAFNYEPEMTLQKPVAVVMRATVVENSSVSDEEELELLESLSPSKRLSRSEKKRLAREQKQILRLQQIEKQKLLTSAAQKMLVDAVQEQEFQQKQSVEQKKSVEPSTLSVKKTQIARLEQQAPEDRFKEIEAQKQRNQSREQLQAAIKQKVMTLWQSPSGTEGRACTVRVQLSVTGRVKKVSVQQSSGSKLFDNSIKRAIYKAGRFQMPNDKELVAELLSGFLLDFGRD